MLTRIATALTLDALNLVGRGIGSLLAGADEVLSRRTLDHLTVREIEERGNAGTLRFGQVKEILAVEERQQKVARK